MDELFAPPGEAWQQVSPKLVVQRRLFTGAGLGLLLVGLAVVMLVLDAPPLSFVATGILWLDVFAWAFVTVTRNARSWAYAEREEELYIRRGVMFRRLVAVPYGRMQYVDVHAGPLDQLFGIANIHLHTAAPGTSAVIPGLPAAEAARLRDRLTSLGEVQAAGL